MSNEKAIISQLDIAEKAMLRDVLSFMVCNSLSLKERHFSYAGNNDYYNLCRDHF